MEREQGVRGVCGFGTRANSIRGPIRMCVRVCVCACVCARVRACGCGRDMGLRRQLGKVGKKLRHWELDGRGGIGLGVASESAEGGEEALSGDRTRRELERHRRGGGRVGRLRRSEQVGVALHG